MLEKRLLLITISDANENSRKIKCFETQLKMAAIVKPVPYNSVYKPHEIRLIRVRHLRRYSRPGMSVHEVKSWLFSTLDVFFLERYLVLKVFGMPYVTSGKVVVEGNCLIASPHVKSRILAVFFFKNLFARFYPSSRYMPLEVAQNKEMEAKGVTRDIPSKDKCLVLIICA